MGRERRAATIHIPVSGTQQPAADRDRVLHVDRAQLMQPDVLERCAQRQVESFARHVGEVERRSGEHYHHGVDPHPTADSSPPRCV